MESTRDFVKGILSSEEKVSATSRQYSGETETLKAEIDRLDRQMLFGANGRPIMQDLTSSSIVDTPEIIHAVARAFFEEAHLEITSRDPIAVNLHLNNWRIFPIRNAVKYGPFVEVVRSHWMESALRIPRRGVKENVVEESDFSVPGVPLVGASCFQKFIDELEPTKSETPITLDNSKKKPEVGIFSRAFYTKEVRCRGSLSKSCHRKG